MTEKQKRTFEDTHAMKPGESRSADASVDPYENVLTLVRNELANTFSADELSSAGPKVTETASSIAKKHYDKYNEDALAKGKSQVNIPEEIFIETALSELLGMGAVEKLLADESVEDIAINGPNEVYVYRHGSWEEDTSIRFRSPSRLLEVLNRGMAHSGRKANIVSPIADAVLKKGERISVVTYPISKTYPVAVIRIPSAQVITLEQMIEPYSEEDDDQKVAPTPDFEGMIEGEATGFLSPAAAAYLNAAVLTGLNIVAIGPTGSGKTTLLKELGRRIPKGERILIIEDTPEIDLNPGDEKPNNVIYLRTRPATIEGLKAVEQEDLVKLALRQRPDALTLGEARGAEVFDLLNALNTGHKNGLTSLHAYGVHELFSRVYMMLSQSERGRHLDSYRAANLVAQTLHIAVSIEVIGKRRYVRTIAELTGDIEHRGPAYEPKMQAIFSRESRRTKLDGPLCESAHGHIFEIAGVPVSVYTPS